jgi:hypothetical protein
LDTTTRSTLETSGDFSDKRKRKTISVFIAFINSKVATEYLSRVKYKIYDGLLSLVFQTVILYRTGCFHADGSSSRIIARNNFLFMSPQSLEQIALLSSLKNVIVKISGDFRTWLTIAASRTTSRMQSVSHNGTIHSPHVGHLATRQKSDPATFRYCVVVVVSYCQSCRSLSKMSLSTYVTNYSYINCLS